MLNLSLMTPDQANSWNLFRGKSCKRKMESDIRIKSSFPTRLVFGTILLLSYVSLDIKYPYSVLFPSVLASSLGPFRVAPNRRITPFYKLVTTISRGGSSDEEEGPVEENSKEGSEGEAGESDNNLYDDEQNEDLQTQQRESKHNPMASFAAPFRMNEATKEEALKSSTSSSTSSDSSSSDGEDEQSDENETKNNKKNLSGTSVGTSGATMVKAKPPRRNKVMSALDTSRVAPLSSRLMDENSANGDVPLEEDEDTELSPDEEESDDMEETEEDMEKSSESSSSREMTEMAKLWWVNVRQIYLSEIDGDEDDVESDEFIVSNETSSSTEENRRSERNETTTDDESASSSSVEQDKATEMDGSLGESNALEEANVEILESANPEDSPVPPDSVLEESNTGFAESHPYVSSGVWYLLDNVLTLGLASRNPSWQLSRGLRGIRKVCARVTGLHGLLSGKPRASLTTHTVANVTDAQIAGVEEDENLSEIRNRIVAIDRAREGVERAQAEDAKAMRRRGWLGGVRQGTEDSAGVNVTVDESRTAILQEDKEYLRKQKEREEALTKQREEEEALAKKRLEEEAIAERRRMDRVKEIDKLIVEAQENLQKLACEKDVLQRRPNPLWNYTTTEVPPTEEANTTASGVGITAARKFNFPPSDLVEEYLDMMFSSRRLIKMNHTFLWKDSEQNDDDDDESIGDDLLTPSADAHKLYTEKDDEGRRRNGRHKNGGGGSWLLRQSIAGGPSLGEKIGEAAEKAAYKAICAAVMSFLARTLSSLHGINVMKYSDIRLVLEAAPDLPPVSAGVIPGSIDNYAQETIKTVIRRKAKKQKKRSKSRLSEDAFLQRDAVTEMLLSHVQISAPLLKLFPLAWQRAFLGNIITLATSVMSDFFDGLQFQILGHQLSFAFKPITEADMINHLGLAGGGFNHRRARPEQFEAAVRATAEDVSEGLKFLDRWHERALGSGVLRTQIANLIARIVLTLADEVLSGARMDLWSAPAGGPRMLAGLEYRTSPQNLTNS